MWVDEFGDLCLWCFGQVGADHICKNCGKDQSEAYDFGQAIPPGEILDGHYLIGHTLGQGGFGITYLAYDLNLRVKRAIKEFFPSGIVERSSGKVCVTRSANQAIFTKGVEDFYREAQSIAKFGTHPNIVTIHDFFHENNTAYFVMDYVEGISLSRYLDLHGGTLDYRTTQKILQPIGDALTVLHNDEPKLLHRDVKPDNIFITAEGKPILLDFGAARYETGERTNSSNIVLTPGYAPPEQYGAMTNQGPYTDVYALAATFYHLISGEKPEGALDRLLEDRLKPLNQVVPSLPASVSYAVSHAMELQHKSRTASIQQFFLEMNEKKSISDAVSKPKSRPKWILLTAAAVLILAAGFWFRSEFLQRKDGEPAQLTSIPGDIPSPLYAHTESEPALTFTEISAQSASSGITTGITPTAETPSATPDLIGTAFTETEQIRQVIATGIALTQASIPTDTLIPTKTETPSATPDLIGTAFTETEQIRQVIATGIALTQASAPTKTPQPSATREALLINTPTQKPHLNADEVFIRGNTIFLGNYPQTGSQGEPIEWRILERKSNGSVLLLSKYALDARRFSNGPNTWYDETIKAHRSEIREWLNRTFFGDAFTSEEKNIIKTVTNTSLELDPSEDRVFLLSLEEVKEYLPSEWDRQVEATDYAINERDIYIQPANGRTTWWTRTYAVKTDAGSTVYCIQSTGVIPPGGCITTEKDTGVVPAIWISEDDYIAYYESQ